MSGPPAASGPANLKRNPSSDVFLAQRSALIDYATPIVGDRSRAEDIVQEAFVRFAPAMESGQAGVEQPAAYLFRIVRNLALDWKRRRQIERRQEAAEPEWWMLPETPQTPEQRLIQTESLTSIESVLAELPLQMRQAVELVRFQGYTVHEAGQQLGISGATVSRLVAKAMVKVIAALNGNTGEA